MSAATSTPDPYAHCERECTHDLARGVLLSELLGGDGPAPPLWAPAGPGGGIVLRVLQDETPERLAA
jgi:hypothetical protein